MILGANRRHPLLSRSGALPLLCQGLARAARISTLGEAACAALYDAAAVLLLRAAALLLAAERGALPADAAGALARLADARPDPSGHALWYDLRARWDATSGGAALADAGHPFLALPVADAALAPALAALAALLADDAAPGAGPARRLGDLHEALMAHRLAGATPADLRLVPGGARHGTGGYYTPAPLVDALVADVVHPLLRARLAALDSELAALQEAWSSAGDAGRARVRAAGARAVDAGLLQLRICDPAVGSGHFLVAAARALVAAGDELLRRAPWAGEGAAAPSPARVLRCLYGVDLSRRAVDLARISLWLEVAPALPLAQVGPHLRVGNSLLLDWPQTFPAAFADGAPGFDVVLGNPPWASFSGRERAAADPAELAAYRERYAAFRGWPALHTLFGELAARLLRPGGRLGLVLPDQVGYLARYRAFRALLAGEAAWLSSARYLGEGVFAGVVSPTLLLVAGPPTPPPELVHITSRDGRAAAGPRAALEGDPQLAWAAAARDVLWRKVHAVAARLPAAFGDPGVHTGNCARALLLDAPAGRCAPLAEGADVGRYRLGPPRRWIRLDYAPTAGEYCTVRDAAVYRRARLVIRQTAAHPVAAMHDGGMFRNSLLACYGAPPLDDYYLLALLNSRLLRELYRDCFVEARQRAFPQVKVAHLRQLPFRRIEFPEPRDAHAPLVARLMACYDAGDDDTLLRLVEEQIAARPARADVVHDLLAHLARRMVERTAAGEPTARLDALIDRVVYRLYELSDDEVAQLDQD